jgi:putative hydrolase of the HAD superfamily
MFDLIAFDADDTLWHNENLYAMGRDRFFQLLAHWDLGERAEVRMNEIILDNLKYFGYGVMSYVLSLMEAAISLTGGEISGRELQSLLDLAKEMIDAEVSVYEHAHETLAALSARYPLMLITKGDLRHQEAKVVRSGLMPYFRFIEIVSDKTPQMYTAILERRQVEPGRFLMVGNSPRSDIFPVIELGGWAIYIPNDLTWAHEHVTNPEEYPERYFEADHLGQVPALVEAVEKKYGG